MVTTLSVYRTNGECVITKLFYSKISHDYTVPYFLPALNFALKAKTRANTLSSRCQRYVSKDCYRLVFAQPLSKGDNAPCLSSYLLVDDAIFVNNNYLCHN